MGNNQSYIEEPQVKTPEEQYSEIVTKINRTTGRKLFEFEYSENDYEYIIKLFNNQITDFSTDTKYYEITGIYFYYQDQFDNAIKWFSMAYNEFNDLKFLSYISYSYYMKKNYEEAIKNLQIVINNNCSVNSLIHYICASEKFYDQTKNIKIIENMFEQVTSIIDRIKKEDIDEIINIIYYETNYFNEIFYDYYCFLRKNKKIHKSFTNKLLDINKKQTDFIKIFDDLYLNKEKNVNICDFCNNTNICYNDLVTTVNYCKCCYLSKL